MSDNCSKPELENMVLRQMAFESIFTAENLAFSDEEFQQEYQEAKREFEESESEFDDARLQEQVAENLKVCVLAIVLLAVVETLVYSWLCFLPNRTDFWLPLQLVLLQTC